MDLLLKAVVIVVVFGAGWIGNEVYQKRGAK